MLAARHGCGREFAALVSSTPTISTTCQQVANMASRLQSSRVTTVTMLLLDHLPFRITSLQEPL